MSAVNFQLLLPLLLLRSLSLLLARAQFSGLDNSPLLSFRAVERLQEPNGTSIGYVHRTENLLLVRFNTQNHRFLISLKADPSPLNLRFSGKAETVSDTLFTGFL